MEIRFGQPVDGRGGQLGEVIAVAVSDSTWTLVRVLVEPEHRLGLGRWVRFDLLRDDAGGLVADLDPDEFEALPPGETTELVEGVSTNVWRLPAAPVIRQVAKEVAGPGERVLNAATPLLADGDDVGPLGGFVVDPSGRVESLVRIRRKLLGHSEEVIPIDGATLSDGGIRLVPGHPRG